MKRIFASFLITVALCAPLAAQTVSNGRATTAAPTYPNATAQPLSLDTGGGLRVNCVTGCGGSGTVDSNIVQIGGVPLAYGQQAMAASIPVVIASNQTSFPVTGSGTFAVTQSTSPWVVAGNVASGAADSGNPNKVGGVYNTSMPALTAGQRGDAQVDVSGNMRARIVGPLTSGADAVTNGTISSVTRSDTQSTTLTPLATALWGFNGTSFDRIRTDATATGAMYMINRDAAGNARGANVTAANELNVIGPQTATTNAAVPTKAALAGARSGANIVELIQASASAALTMSTATTTQFVALSGTTKIYITSFDFVAAGTTNVTLVYGTGANCGTGTTALTGAYTLTAQSGVAKGSGIGPVLVVPAGNAFCVTNSQAIVIGGSISYTQF